MRTHEVTLMQADINEASENEVLKEQEGIACKASLKEALARAHDVVSDVATLCPTPSAFVSGVDATSGSSVATPGIACLTRDASLEQRAPVPVLQACAAASSRSYSLLAAKVGSTASDATSTSSPRLVVRAAAGVDMNASSTASPERVQSPGAKATATQQTTTTSTGSPACKFRSTSPRQTARTLR